MKPRISRITAVGVLLAAALMVFVLPAGVAAGAPSAPASGSSETVWAYGAARTSSFTGTTSDGWTYQGQAIYGFSVILNQTNTSATTFELSLQRVMGALITIELCTPDCSAATSTANFTYHAWEVAGAWGNFTTAGSVTEGASTVAAIALENSHSFANASLVESSSSDLAGTLRSKVLTVTTAAAAQINFTGPLGLIPDDLAPGHPQSWSSTSSFNATGSSGWSYGYVQQGPFLNKTVGPITGTTNLTGSGNVTISGRYSAGQQIKLGGVTFPEIALTVTGPFSVREGVIFVPSSSDLFSGSTEPWSSNVNGSATAEMTYLDALPEAGDHVGLGGSVWSYASTSTNPADSLSLSPTSGITPGAASVSPAVPSETVQGEPQNQTQAEQTQNCLISGSACPAVTPGPASSPSHWWRGLFGLAILGAVAAVLVAVVVVVAERRRMPPPVYPNAGLYPPGSMGPTSPSGRARGPDEPPPADDDPLRNLW
jgi:hypothetical protein